MRRHAAQREPRRGRDVCLELHGVRNICLRHKLQAHWRERRHGQTQHARRARRIRARTILLQVRHPVPVAVQACVGGIARQQAIREFPRVGHSVTVGVGVWHRQGRDRAGRGPERVRHHEEIISGERRRHVAAHQRGVGRARQIGAEESPLIPQWRAARRDGGERGRAAARHHAVCRRQRNDRRGRPLHAGQRQLEAEVGAARRVLVNLGGDDVHALDEQRGIHVRGQGGRAVVGRGHRRERAVKNRSRRQVVAEDFRAVQIHDDAVIATHAQAQADERRGVRDADGATEIGGRVFRRRVGAEADQRGLVAVAVAELRRAVAPRQVAVRGDPGRAEIDSLIEVTPDRAGGDQRDRRAAVIEHADIDHAAGRARVLVVRGHGVERVRAEGRERPGETPRGRHGVLAELHAVREELDLAHAAVRVARRRVEDHIRTVRKGRAVRGIHERDLRENIRDHGDAHGRGGRAESAVIACDGGERVRAGRHAAPVRGEGCVGELNELRAIDEKIHAGQQAVNVRGRRAERDAGRRGEHGVRGRTGDVNTRHHRAKRAGEFQIEADVAAAQALLVNFHGEKVRAVDEQRGIYVGRNPVQAVIRRRHCGQRVEGRRPGAQVVALNLRAVQIHHDAVVALHAALQAEITKRVREHKRAAEISRDVFVRAVRAEAHDRRLIAVPVAELRRTVAPGVVGKSHVRPRGAEVGAFVVKPPHGASGKRCCRHRLENHHGHRRGNADAKIIVARPRRERVGAGGGVAPRHGIGRVRVRAEADAVGEKLDVRHRAVHVDRVGVDGQIGRRNERRVWRGRGDGDAGRGVEEIGAARRVARGEPVRGIVAERAGHEPLQGRPRAVRRHGPRQLVVVAHGINGDVGHAVRGGRAGALEFQILAAVLKLSGERTDDWHRRRHIVFRAERRRVGLHEQQKGVGQQREIRREGVTESVQPPGVRRHQRIEERDVRARKIVNFDELIEAEVGVILDFVDDHGTDARAGVGGAKRAADLRRIQLVAHAVQVAPEAHVRRGRAEGQPVAVAGQVRVRIAGEQINFLAE